ncbi:hypothetical protein L6452_14521 [Arctium lappa]|uniref:Uncharacterized protein n=1 Tax=Arctium lappa TaxID=4217 RepID=A0ACB9CLG6_ARCLA|nr:hypothetical protein L6452_14521 [Arctium lappa]
MIFDNGVTYLAFFPLINGGQRFGRCNGLVDANSTGDMVDKDVDVCETTLIRSQSGGNHDVGSSNMLSSKNAVGYEGGCRSSETTVFDAIDVCDRRHRPQQIVVVDRLPLLSLTLVGCFSGDETGELRYALLNRLLRILRDLLICRQRLFHDPAHVSNRQDLSCSLADNSPPGL